MKKTKIVQGAYQYFLLCLHFNLSNIKPVIDSKSLFWDNFDRLGGTIVSMARAAF